MKKKGFTLIELMVVILIVGILAAASVPLMRGRIDKAKWSEANAMAGTIQSAARVYWVENGSGSLSGVSMTELGFNSGDLEGTYFTAGDFTISTVDDSSGKVAVTVTGSKANAPSGTYILGTDGSWTASGS